MRGRDLFAKYKSILTLLVKYYSFFPVKTRVRFLEKHRNTRGKLGLAVRYALLKSVAAHCGDNVAVYQGVFLQNPQNLSIGNNVSIQPMCYIECLGGVEIHDDVSIAHGATIMSTSHNFKDKNSLIKDQGVSTNKVIISQNVWIGAKATILFGVTIGKDCVIGASSVATRNCESNSVYVGAPAKKIKQLYESNIGS